MDTVFFIVVAVLILFFSFFYALLGKKLPKSVNAYFLTSKGLNFWGLCLTIVATQLGGGAILGVSNTAYKYGCCAVLYPVGIALGLFIIAWKFAEPLQQSQSGTIARALSHSLQSNLILFITSLLSILTLFTILVATAVATRQLLSFVGIVSIIPSLAIWVIFLVYTSIGGLQSVVKSDIVQVLFILTTFIIVVFIMLLGKTPVFITPTFVFNVKSIPWVDWLIMPALFVIMSQDMGQRCFAAVSVKVLKKSMICAGILLVSASILPVWLGLLARTHSVEVTENVGVLFVTLKTLASSKVCAVMAAAVMVALISTADSLLCALSSNLILDFEITSVSLTRFFSFILGLLAYVVSFYSDEIIPIMLLGYELSVVVIFVPFIMVFACKRPCKIAALVAMFWGVLSFVVTYIMQWKNITILVVIINFVVYVTIDNLRKKRVL